MFEYRAKIVSVYDGDTCRADIDLGFGVILKNQSIRAYGIDTPEIPTTEGIQSREFAKSILAVGTSVTITTFKDAKGKYGRYLAKIIMPDGSDFSTSMIDANHAKPYFGGSRK